MLRIAAREMKKEDAYLIMKIPVLENDFPYFCEVQLNILKIGIRGVTTLPIIRRYLAPFF